MSLTKNYPYGTENLILIEEVFYRVFLYRGFLQRGFTVCHFLFATISTYRTSFCSRQVRSSPGSYRHARNIVRFTATMCVWVRDFSECAIFRSGRNPKILLLPVNLSIEMRLSLVPKPIIAHYFSAIPGWEHCDLFGNQNQCHLNTQIYRQHEYLRYP